MKKKIFVFSIIASIGYIALTSSDTGAAHGGGYNCTGSETGHGNSAGCSQGNSCHSTSATTGIGVVLTIDSVGNVPVTKYKAGITYTVTITGTNNTVNTLPKFGFQVSAIKGATAQSVPVNAGTLQQSGLPTSVRYTPAVLNPQILFEANVIEHGAPIAATTGTGGTGTTYQESFTWVAPVAGTGTVSFWAALNAVDGDDQATNNDKWNITNATLTEEGGPTAVNTVTGNENIKLYPNPVHDQLTIQMNNAANAVSTINVYNLSGQLITTEHTNAQLYLLNTHNWPNGMYAVEILNTYTRNVTSIVKN